MEEQDPVEDVQELPAADLARRLSDWLSGPRSRALRKAQIGLCQHVLEVGAGHCVVTPELQRRARGKVISIDLLSAFRDAVRVQQLTGIAADGQALPFRDESFDLVFFQNTLLWVAEPGMALQEATRVLQAEGTIVAIEPDYGGMMEYPELDLRETWIAALDRAGADPWIGRKLPALCEAAGLEVSVELAHLPRRTQGDAVALLEDLPLNDEELQRVHAARATVEQSRGWACFLHVPYFLITATKRR